MTASLPPSLVTRYGATLAFERAFVVSLSQSGASPDIVRTLEADGSLLLDKDGTQHRLSPYEVAAFIIVSMADTIEQWFSWQDDIFSRFPDVQHRNQKAHWAASLWPGPMRPSGRIVAR